MGKDLRSIDGCIVGRVQPGHRVVLTGSEGVAADDHARALYGAKSNPSAVLKAVATSALQMMVPQSTAEPIELDTVLSAHKMLMEDDPAETRSPSARRPGEARSEVKSRNAVTRDDPEPQVLVGRSATGGVADPLRRSHARAQKAPQ